MALVVAPLLVLMSPLLGHPMTLVFASPLDLFAIAEAVLIVNSVAGDGETTWFEGLLLVGVHALLGFGFFFAGGCLRVWDCQGRPRDPISGLRYTGPTRRPP